MTAEEKEGNLGEWDRLVSGNYEAPLSGDQRLLVDRQRHDDMAKGVGRYSIGYEVEFGNKLAMVETPGFRVEGFAAILAPALTAFPDDLANILIHQYQFHR